jgi:excinuclease ABC subunit A
MLADSMSDLVVVGARQHNLKDLSCRLPRNSLVVITGPSGSGKSSLAFDTIYAEGQRRYVESLSVSARQFFRQLPKPDVLRIDGLSPSVAIEQRSVATSPRSTVGTATELSDYLRVLFARASTARCPATGEALRAYTPQEIVDLARERGEGTKVVVLGPVRRRSQENLGPILDELRREGFARVRLDGVDLDLGGEAPPTPPQPYDLDVVVDRAVVRDSNTTRLTDSIELALSLGDGVMGLDFIDGAPPLRLSSRLISWESGESLPDPQPRLFSFNSPHGACPDCNGLGEQTAIDPDLVITDATRSLRQGAIGALGRRGSVARSVALDRIVKTLGVDPDRPWNELEETDRDRVLFGRQSKRKAERYEGLVAMLERLSEGDSPSEQLGTDEDGALTSDDAKNFFSRQICPTCNGRRLRREALAFTVDDRTIADLASLELQELRSWVGRMLDRLPFEPNQRPVAESLLEAVAERLDFLQRVGLATLTMSRTIASLSGGERQRIRLATQLGTSLVGVLYVLDEPSVGLHPENNENLLAAIRSLVERGNTVLVVEHDRDAIMAADFVLDMGPGAGRHGGEIVAQGTPQELMKNPRSATGPYLRAGPEPLVHERKRPGESSLGIRGATTHNLAGVDVDFPLGLVTAVTGVSGSGKSSLVVDTLLPAARCALNGARLSGVPPVEVLGLENLERVSSVDQRPLGKTPRSNPATYTGIFALLRQLYAELPEAKARGYKAGRFSFNVKGGRCEKCQGDGAVRVSMHFLPDIYVQCESCGGLRYNRETLQLTYRGHNIAQALQCTVDEASELFANVPKIAQRLAGLQRIGLGYLSLGQSATTLSGGEAQRLKLATELFRRDTGRTLYVLDEPTTGLHFRDLETLWVGISQLRDEGNTILVIEHNMELVARADWVVDLGPGAGRDGGSVVAQGTPEQVAKAEHSRTAHYLAKALH